MKTALAILSVILSLPVFAGDSTSNALPSVAPRTGVAGAACTVAYERAMTASGVPLICYGGLWKAEDVADKGRYSVYYPRAPADDNTTKVLISYCPVGWKAVGGDCNFDGNTTESKNVLGHTDGDRGYWCFFSFRNAYAVSPFGPLGVQSTVDCVRLN